MISFLLFFFIKLNINAMDGGYNCEIPKMHEWEIQKPNKGINFSDLKGINQETKESVHAIIRKDYENPKNIKRILFCGFPQYGKWHIAEGMVSEIFNKGNQELSVIYVKGKNFTKNYNGSSEENIKNLFITAQKAVKSRKECNSVIILIKNIDELFCDLSKKAGEGLVFELEFLDPKIKIIATASVPYPGNKLFKLFDEVVIVRKPGKEQVKELIICHPIVNYLKLILEECFNGMTEEEQLSVLIDLFFNPNKNVKDDAFFSTVGVLQVLNEGLELVKKDKKISLFNAFKEVLEVEYEKNKFSEYQILLSKIKGMPSQEKMSSEEMFESVILRNELEEIQEEIMRSKEERNFISLMKKFNEMRAKIRSEEEREGLSLIDKMYETTISSEEEGFSSEFEKMMSPEYNEPD